MSSQASSAKPQLQLSLKRLETGSSEDIDAKAKVRWSKFRRVFVNDRTDDVTTQVDHDDDVKLTSSPGKKPIWFFS